ncbi:MAG: hypothetical protein DWP95_12975 [Proteobacteria bacterium]|nr:MAG: hypothetical protein DWP95_12975 [Pseudomonadota bacterium]
MKTKAILFILTLILLTYFVFLKDRSSVTKLLPADVVLPDNSQYYGEIKDGLFDGKGELIWADGTRYVGQFKKGLMHGSGELWENTGSHYKGSFKDGMMHGGGTFIFFDGTEYEGAFIRNHLSGRGIMRTNDNNIYEGEFDRGVLVNGTHIDPSGTVNEGTFKNWLLEGKGSYTTNSGDIYSGYFEEGMLNGQGQITMSNGSHYEGDVVEWFYHGKGKLTDEDGNQYQGEFEYGEYHGEGILVLASPVAGISEISGQWEYGYNPNDPRLAGKSRRNKLPVDDLLYKQNKLLFDSLLNVSKHNDNKIDMYFFGMAAHSESVFYKEIDYIESYFAKHFGTEDKSITLLNNPLKKQEKPLLTNHSIKEVLTGLAEKMDVNQDILFLYLTSHGTKQQISVSYPGLTLSQIDAEDFGKVIKDSPIKWKVIMISACYSGSFMPFLENDYHLVMTAAREDRTSFGCGEDSDMTYFAKAMFKEAMPHQQTFIAAFEDAKKTIEQWEINDFPDSKHSEPQIYVGKNMTAHLKHWRNQITKHD